MPFWSSSYRTILTRHAAPAAAALAEVDELHLEGERRVRRNFAHRLLAASILGLDGDGGLLALFIVATATSHPFMTSPLPSLNSKEPVTESLVVSKTLPLSSLPVYSSSHFIRLQAARRALPSPPSDATAAQPLLDAMRREAAAQDAEHVQERRQGRGTPSTRSSGCLLPASLRAPEDATVSGLEALACAVLTRNPQPSCAGARAPSSHPLRRGEIAARGPRNRDAAHQRA